MATFLDIPREIYLVICSLLSTADHVSLSRLNRSHYLAAQRPLYSDVRVKQFSALINLVEALGRVPVVSSISQPQRLCWRQVLDSELSERRVEHLSLVLNICEDGGGITGAMLAQCLNSITCKSSDTKISLTLVSITAELSFQLSQFRMPGIVDLTVFVSGDDRVSSQSTTGRAMGNFAITHRARRTALVHPIWECLFSGSIFPDLRTVSFNSMIEATSPIPSDLGEGFFIARQRLINEQRRDVDTVDLFNSPRNRMKLFAAIASMRVIKFERNSLLDGHILKSLFAPTADLSQLARLEIVNCPLLHPVFDLEAIASFLRLALSQVRSLKLHLYRHHDGHYGYGIAYASKINTHSDLHLCHIIRELGEDIQCLDMEMPFACPHVFSSGILIRRGTSGAANSSQSNEYSSSNLQSTRTHPDQLVTKGLQYRRLVFNDFCIEGGDWDEMELGVRQAGDKITWDLRYESIDGVTLRDISTVDGHRCSLSRDRAVS